jgi:hypothetical protein
MGVRQDDGNGCDARWGCRWLVIHVCFAVLVSTVKPDILAKRYSTKDVGDGELIRGGCRVSDERTHCLFWRRPQAPRAHWLSSVLIAKGVRKPADEACNFALSRLPPRS